MSEAEFRALFLRALNSAADEVGMGSVDRSFLIELHAPEAAGCRVSVDEAVEHLYLGPDRFYRIVDVAIKELLAGGGLAFVRVSGHRPGDFGKTWDPAGLGPFKQISAAPVVDRRRIGSERVASDVLP